MKILNKILVISIAFFLVLPIQTLNAFAQEVIKRNVVITGYYSPLPDQKYYVKGSLEADKRLNGNGTNGASGRPVFQGMIAAPKDYPFGTKIYIPGLGVGTVADRGGAIISNYKDHVFCQETDTGCDRVDRLDLWMGHGDEGLARALYQIGVKRAEALIYPPGTDMSDSIVFADIDTGKLPKGTYTTTKVVSAGVSDSAKNEAAQALKVLGFHDGSAENLEEDIYRFQKKNGIVSSASDTGAGYLGPQTRAQLKTALEEFHASVASQVPGDNLGKYSHGASVSELQTVLKTLGYYKGEVTGTYDKKTIEAVYAFQEAKKLVDSDKDAGAGYFGPKTRDVLKEDVLVHERVSRRSAVDAELPRKEKSNEPSHSSVAEVESFLNKDVSQYDKGDNVEKLQEFLTKLGYLDHEPTGYYGELTVDAVTQFQKDHDIISTDTEVGAGRLGPVTRAKLASVIKEQEKPKVVRMIQATTVAGIAKKSTAQPDVKSAPSASAI